MEHCRKVIGPAGHEHSRCETAVPKCRLKMLKLFTGLQQGSVLVACVV